MSLPSASKTPSSGGIGTVIAYGGMKKALLLAAIAGAYFAGRADVPRDAKLENKRVRVIEMDYKPGEPRIRSIRPADQVIVFLDDSRYERVDPEAMAISDWRGTGR